MAEALESRRLEMLRLSELLARAQSDCERLNSELHELRRHEAARAHEDNARRAALDAAGRRNAFLEDKIAWLTLDRDRFRSAYERVIRSLSWSVTRPLRRGRTPLSPRVSSRVTPVVHAEAPVQAQPAAPATPVAAVVHQTEFPRSAAWFRAALRSG